MTRVSTFTNDALGDDDAVGLAARLRAGEVSAPDLVEAAIARVEAVDPALHADWEGARAEAAAPRGGVAFTPLQNATGDPAAGVGPPARGGPSLAADRAPDPR